MQVAPSTYYSAKSRPARSRVLDAHTVKQHVVLGSRDQVLNTEPAELQAWTDDVASRIHCPAVAVFGRPATDGERERLHGLADVQVEEWSGDGHFVHLVDPQRFATRLLAFIAHSNRTF